MAYLSKTKIQDGAGNDLTSTLTTDGKRNLDVNLNISPFEFGNDGRVRTGQETLLFFDQINGNTINSELWKATLATMAISQVNGTILLNSASSLAANGYYNLISNKAFNRIFEFPIYITSQFFYTMGNTEIAEFGIMSVATNAAPTDGFFIRFSPSGVFGVVTVAGVETTSQLVGVTPNTNCYMAITVLDTSIEFEVEDILLNKYTTSIKVLPSASANARLPIAARVYNGATVATTATTLSLFSVTVIQMDWAANKMFDQQMSSATHNMSSVEPNTFLKTANWTNSTAASNAALSNTAASYATLGGLFRFSSATGAATDYALFGYLVPAGFTLVINAIYIDTAITTALGATAAVLQWAAGIGSSAVSLATTDAWPTTSAPKYIPLGMQSFIASAAIGVMGTPIGKQFNTPLIIEGGEYLHIILRQIAGTTTGRFSGQVLIEGYFE